MRTNVYYLAAPTPAFERVSRLSPGLHLLAFWCRLRLTAAEIAAALRRFGGENLDTDPVLLGQRADLVLAVPPPPGRPARIIDLAAARIRLRP